MAIGIFDFTLIFKSINTSPHSQTQTCDLAILIQSVDPVSRLWLVDTFALTYGHDITKVPRNFLLLEELEKGEKGSNPHVSWGLGCIADELVSMRVHCGTKYPDVVPTVTFVSKKNFPFLNASGEVNISKVKNIRWTREWTIEKLVTGIKSEMESPQYAKLSQPADGEY